MPKRPNPSKKDDDDEAKKARTNSVPNGSDNGAGSVTVTGMDRLSAATATTAIAVVTRVVLPQTAADAAAPVSKAQSKQSPSAKRNGSSGGNKFLNSLRTTPTRTVSNGGNGETKPSNATRNGEEAAEPADAVAAPPAPASNEPSSTEPVANNNGTGAPAKTPGVPFPQLPRENESDPKRWIGLPSMMIMLILFLLNTASAIHIGSRRTLQNTTRTKYDIELEKLNEELARSRGEVLVLRDGMNKLELAREARELIWAGHAEEFPGAFGPRKGAGPDALLTSEDRKVWLEKLRVLESDKLSAADEFDDNLSRFAEHETS